MPDFSGAYKYSTGLGLRPGRGHAARRSSGTTLLDDEFDLSGDATGWGLNLSSNLKAGRRTSIRLQFVFGEGIQNYMNDAPVDIGIAEQLPELR